MEWEDSSPAGDPVPEEGRAGPEPQFVAPVPEDYQCHICLMAARDAVVTEHCGHLFCSECILRALRDKAECPVDRLPLSCDQIRKDIRAQRKIQSLKVMCPHHDSGCPWIGDLGDHAAHARGCEHSAMPCPFEGCPAVLTRNTYDAHLEAAAGAHLLLMGRALTLLKAECVRLRVAAAGSERLLTLALDSDHFLWSLPDFESRSGAEVSKIFKAKGLAWYMKIDFEESAQYSALYLYASGHTKRVVFQFLLFNQNPDRDEVLLIDDWHPDFKGKGWGNKRFIDRLALCEAGFVSEAGRVTVGVQVMGVPF